MKHLKKILNIILWILIISGSITVFAFIQNKGNSTICGALNIFIQYDSLKENYFIREDHIRKLIAERFGQVENIPVKNIDINYLERLMYANPWVYRADVYLTINGVVDIIIEPREPILRIINRYGESYYMDSNGRLMPWSPDFTPYVPVLTGNISETYTQWHRITVAEIINNDTLKTCTMLDDFYLMAKFILADKFWSSHIEQIYLNNRGEMELIPKVGNHRIVFGTSDNLEEKFWKLETFYKKGMNRIGWGDYDTLNLKFANQVVCTKATYK